MHNSEKDIFANQTSNEAERMRAEITRVARRPYNVLVTGETGTGKTLMARQIHRLSARANQPFVELNCANLPEHLVEAELFGHRKGAFTGAAYDRKGLFEEADGGILFLDEIGDIPLTIQNRLLKAIEEKQIKRLGSNNYQALDVQVIAATSRQLTEMVRDGQFREDLYCRLAVLTVKTCSLKERREDIPAMISQFLSEAAEAVFGATSHSGNFTMDQEAVALLCGRDYPGNIRSLRNLVYELTSYIEDQESITVDLVTFVLSGLELSQWAEVESVVPHSWLTSIAKEGDIILPIELCVLRHEETFKQWTARARRCSIEATRRATGGPMEVVAERLGLTRSSLKSHLQRAKRIQKETLFDLKERS
jgi:DNA-binding NtrC family response regulator